MLMFWIYILQNPKGRFYIGHSDDLITRVANHNRVDKTLGKFTRKNGPWVLPWSEEHAERSSAMRREHQILEIRQTHSNHPSCAAQLARWHSPTTIGINRLIVGSNPTSGAKF